ncbi:MAG: TonB family protein [Deltaproteobacteria bacterium]|nr:TonB family protein [Deltaproteobacteria bacterium]
MLAGAVAVALCGVATAGSGSDKSPDFWSEIARPGLKKLLADLERGQKLATAAAQARTKEGRRRGLEEALSYFLRALRVDPTYAEAHALAGKVQYDLGLTKEAVASLLAVRRLGGGKGEEYSIAFKLGIGYSKLGEFEKAVQEYDRADRIAIVEAGGAPQARSIRATLQANAAESLMALGQLDESIQRYRTAVDLDGSNSLAWWGLAVALDRDEQVSRATVALTRAMAGDAEMRRLSSEDVFFVPAGDLHYYHALGHLARGRNKEAKQAFEAFLSELPRSMWAYRARAHLAVLGAAPSAPRVPAAKRLAPAPAAGATDVDVIAQDRIGIRHRVRSSIYQLQRCYQKELAQKPDVMGRLRVSFVVSLKGKATAVKVVQSTISRATLQRCVVDVIRGLQFTEPASKRPVSVSYPLEFKPN